MKTSVLFPLAVALASAQVHLPFSRRQHSAAGGPAAAVSRRAASEAVHAFGPEPFAFMVNATVGTPPQNVSLVLAPGSQYTWMLDRHGPNCEGSNEEEGYRYCKYGSFDPDLSSTFKQNSSDDSFYSSYGGSYVSGNWVSDTLAFGGVAVSNLPMGLVDSSELFVGILGLGFNDSEHDNFADLLFQQGVIATPAYSLWLDDAGAESGSLLLGAVDTTKFTGFLTRIEATKYSPMYGNVGATIYSINASVPDEPIQHITSYEYLPDLSVALSPGDKFSSLPDPIASQIWELANATFDYDRALIPCSAVDTMPSITLSIMLAGNGGPVISVPMTDLVIPGIVYIEDMGAAGEVEWCLFGVQNGSLSPGFDDTSYVYGGTSAYNLGSTLLRRTYLAVDLVNQEVAVAPVKFGVAESQVVAFDGYGSTIPGAVSYCLDGYSCTADNNYPDSPPESNSRHPSGLGSGVIGVGVAAGAIAIALAVGMALWLTRLGYYGGKRKERDADVVAGKAIASHYERSAPGSVMMSTAPPGAPLPWAVPITSMTPANMTAPAAPTLPSPIAEEAHETLTTRAGGDDEVTPPAVSPIQENASTPPAVSPVEENTPPLPTRASPEPESGPVLPASTAEQQTHKDTP